MVVRGPKRVEVLWRSVTGCSVRCVAGCGVGVGGRRFRVAGCGGWATVPWRRFKVAAPVGLWRLAAAVTGAPAGPGGRSAGACTGSAMRARKHSMRTETDKPPKGEK